MAYHNGVYTPTRWTTQHIVKDWLNGRTWNKSALTCDDFAIRSYDLILAFRNNQGVWLLDSANGISVTTSKHYSAVAGNFAKLGWSTDGEYTIRESGYPNNERKLDRSDTRRKYVRLVLGEN